MERKQPYRSFEIVSKKEQQLWRNFAIVSTSPWLYPSLALGIVLLLGLFGAAFAIHEDRQWQRLTYSQFLGRLEAGQVSEATLRDDRIRGTLESGERFQANAPPGHVVDRLLDAGVSLTVESQSWLERYLTAAFLSLAVAFLVLWGWRQLSRPSDKVMSFGKSRARLFAEDSQRVTFEDVAGLGRAKSEMGQIIAFLREPKKFTRLGGRIPKGILLEGPPGVGKTLLARAIAGEAGVPFFSISASEFVEAFAGVAASRIRDLFLEGKKNAPCLIFIDEIDALGRAISTEAHQERRQALHQLLAEMDGFESNEGVVVIMATTRAEELDPALLRRGRIDRHVHCGLPDPAGREAILQVHSRRVPLAEDVDLEEIARLTPGLSGADLQGVVNDAALLAGQADRDRVPQSAFREALAPSTSRTRPSRGLGSGEDRIRTQAARYTAGQVIVMRRLRLLPEDGFVMVRMPIEKLVAQPDPTAASREELRDLITAAFGGRAAELCLGGQERITSLAEDDLRFASETAERFVRQLGFGEALSLRVVPGETPTSRVAGALIPAETVRRADAEISDLLASCLQRAIEIVEEDREGLAVLVEYFEKNPSLPSGELAMLLVSPRTQALPA